MERSNLKISLIAVLAVVMCAGLASAAPGEKGDGERQRESQRERGDKTDRGEKAERGERRGGGAKALFEGIDLSDDQKQAVREVMDSKKAQRDEIRAEMREARESKDRDAMTAIGEKMQALMDETHQAVRGELTADQQTQFDDNLVKLEAKAAERRANRGEGKKKDKGEHKNGKKKGDRDADNGE